MAEESKEKSQTAKKEEEVLKFWKDSKIFEKTLKKPSPKGEFVFYEGPPTANGKPGIHHLESRSFKDLIPRFKTMQGYHVRRKGGWDTHGLPVEIQVEKELGLKSKREIEEYGILEFNKKCKESVWTYIHEWENFTERIAYWVDLKNPYVTYKPYYIESLWNIIKTVDEKKLLYKDYKVLPWCPRCQTALSSHELAQGYQDVKDLSVTAKFKVKGEENTYLLAWTTTPWTLPGNVALAVGEDVDYVKVKADNASFILAEKRLEILKDVQHEIVKKLKGRELIGLEYESLYPFLKENLPESEKGKLENAFKVYSADFVTTEDGTGIVHTAVMYGQDDFDLGTKVNLPKYHLVNEDGTFKKEVDFLSGKFVKDPETDVLIIKDLAHRGLLFHKEKYSHSYPHCWRCKTPLIYFARDSWYIKMSSLKDKLIKENQKINWEPSYIKEGRFGEWLKEVKDWAISRERFWGTPLPVWQCESCENKEVIGSFEELFIRDKDKSLTRFVLVRHGESEKNIPEEYFDSSEKTFSLTRAGEKKAKEAAKLLSNLNIDVIYSSPVLRAKETAEIIGSKIGKEVIFEDRLWEVKNGEWEGKKVDDPTLQGSRIAYNMLSDEEYYKALRGKNGESWQNVEDRMTSFVKEAAQKHKGETVVIVSHEGPLMCLLRYLKELSLEEISNLWEERRVFHQGLLGGYAEPTSVYMHSKTGREIDPHRPVIDDFKIDCKCGSEMKRVKEVIDVWFDSGAMPFAQDHYPFKNKDFIDKEGFPADFISEAIDQTRGWFYTLHAIGNLLGKGLAYKNVISLGHLLDKEGKKMSKSLGNIVVPKEAIDKFGADALRFWMYSVNQPGDSKNFDESSVDEIVKKVFNPLLNVVSFLELFSDSENNAEETHKPTNILDRWIISYLHKLAEENTEYLNNYKVTEASRNLKDFISDLSQWYVRRSRDRFKSENKEEKQEAINTLRFVLKELSKLMAPFTPFLAEDVYKKVKGEKGKESVHLEDWPKNEAYKIKHGAEILENMKEVRKIVSLALEQRARTSIKVRQPLQTLKVKSLNIDDESLLGLIKDEVNVKEVLSDKNIPEEVELDTNITPELKEEGEIRDFIRYIQEIRKKEGFSPEQKAFLLVQTDEEGKSFINSSKETIFKPTQIKEVRFETVESGDDISIGDKKFSVKISLS